MPAVRQQTGSKWARRAGQATEDYASGVAAPRTSWAQATQAASASHQAGLQAAFARGAFQKGVARAGDSKWARKATQVGAARFAPGVQAAEQDYDAAVAPYLQTIASTTLPARGPKGDPNNIQRVAVMAKALRDKKLTLTGGSR
jgi:hypothetical protein